MSLYDYEKSKHLANQGTPFYALLMAAMRCADDNNKARLRAAFPEVWTELSARYVAPGGRLAGEELP